RIALRVLVRRRRSDRLEHRRPGEVLRRDQLDLAALAFGLALEERSEVRVDVGQPGGGEVLKRLVRDGHTAAPSPFPGSYWRPRRSTGRLRTGRGEKRSDAFERLRTAGR